MPQRVAVVGFAHETNTFSNNLTGLDDFIANGLLRGEELLQLGGTNTVIGGVIERIAAHPSLELISILATSAIPGGPVTNEAAETISNEIVARLTDHRPDAVVL